MGASISAFLQIDDNTPEDDLPFTSAPSTWDLTSDIGLSEGKHYEFYAAICGVRNTSEKQPLFPCRGLPPTGCDSPKNLKELDDDFNVSWLTLPEIHSALSHMDVKIESLRPSVRLVLGAMEVAVNLFGEDRVRLVFQVTD